MYICIYIYVHIYMYMYIYNYIYIYIFHRCAHSAGPKLSLVGPQHERYVQMFASTSVSDEMFWLDCCFGTCQNTK